MICCNFEQSSCQVLFWTQTWISNKSTFASPDPKHPLNPAISYSWMWICQFSTVRGRVIYMEYQIVCSLFKIIPCSIPKYLKVPIIIDDIGDFTAARNKTIFFLIVNLMASQQISFFEWAVFLQYYHHLTLNPIFRSSNRSKKDIACWLLRKAVAYNKPSSSRQSRILDSPTILSQLSLKLIVPSSLIHNNSTALPSSAILLHIAILHDLEIKHK